MEEVISSRWRVLYLKIIWIHGGRKANMKVWESPFIPSHLTFKRFQKGLNQIYLFIITLQNLEFWDVTNLPPLKGISSSRFGEASKKRLGFGGLLKFHRSSPGSGVLPPLEAWLRFHQNSYTPSLFLTVSVFSDRKDNSFSRLFR